jgi:hypothetical protein
MCDAWSDSHLPTYAPTHLLTYSPPLFRRVGTLIGFDMNSNLDKICAHLRAWRKGIHGLHERAAQVSGFEIDHVVSLAGRSVA